MKKTLAKLTLLALAGLSYIGLTGSCIKTTKQICPEPDKYNEEKRVLEEILDSTYPIQFESGYLSLINNEKRKLNSFGMAFLAEIKDEKKYFITSYQKYIIEDKKDEENIYCLQDMKVFLTADEKRYDLKIVSKNENQSILILSSEENLDLKKLIDFSDVELKKGDKIYAVGYSNFQKVFSEGTICGVDETGDFCFFAKPVVKNNFGPVYTLENGKSKFIGFGRPTISFPEGTYLATDNKGLKKELDKTIKMDEKSQDKP